MNSSADSDGSNPQDRIAAALERIALCLEKIANPPMAASSSVTCRAYAETCSPNKYDVIA